MTSAASVVVVGSLNMDLVVRVEELPGAGETVTGSDVFRGPGGKGANQAVAAARLGRFVWMVGCVGNEDAGRALLDGLTAADVDVTHVRILDGVPSGTALIAVDEGGENQIVVSPGANGRLGTAHVEAAADALASAAVTLIQLEIPLDAVEAAVRLAGGVVVLNPAPAREVPPALLREVDVLVPNRGELAHLARAAHLSTSDDVVEAARSVGVKAAVVTLGREGALVVKGGSIAHVPAIPVEVVDTTAAGDAFCGALADALADAAPLEEAARWAVRVAGIACTRLGAQASMPTRSEVPPAEP